jgi:predicted nucleotidyltransferase
MDEIKDRLGNYKYNFFINLQNYLGVDLIFFGSIKRIDFFANASDVDIAVITDNVSSTISKLKQYLNISDKNIKKIYQKFTEKSGEVVIGYKIKFKDEEKDFSFDILVYDEKYRNNVQQNLDDVNNLPFYMIVILCFVKFLYYKLNLMTTDFYMYFKSSLFYMYLNKKIGFYNKTLTSTVILDNF